MMLDIKTLRDTPADCEQALQRRNPTLSLAPLLALDEERRSLLQQEEILRSQRNQLSKEVGELKRAKQNADAQLEASKQVAEQIKHIEAAKNEVEEKQQQWLLEIPNLPHASVPTGRSEDDNPELHRWGCHLKQRPQEAGCPEPKEHWELATDLGWVEFERAVKISKSRFSMFQGEGARLMAALIRFMLDVHTLGYHYRECMPPLLVNADAMTGTGNFPKFKEDAFALADDELYLIPTAEVPLTNTYRDELLLEAQLPIRLTAHTPCFRREAGAAGRDTRGLIRQHQFDKVEMVQITTQEASMQALEGMREQAERILQLLEIPYRVVTLCTGDMGFSATKTYDLEVWLPGQQRYREISSVSNCGDFQARRMNLRYRQESEGGKPTFCHTLNGSGLAVGRTFAALLENYQQPDGSVRLPEVLKPYLATGLPANF
jgi:seryl-tRNA synthetase